jgi:hypothetical protein
VATAREDNLITQLSTQLLIQLSAQTRAGRVLRQRKKGVSRDHQGLRERGEGALACNSSHSPPCQ